MDSSKGNEMEEIHKFTITKTLIAGADIDRIKIYEGTQEDGKNGVSWGKREVAIKRIPKEDREKASIETRAYMELDQTPKIVRCFGAMEDRDFCYLALERAGCNLSEFIWALSQKSNPIKHENHKTKAFLERIINDSKKAFVLWFSCLIGFDFCESAHKNSERLQPALSKQM
jgi:hypothetical protein